MDHRLNRFLIGLAATAGFLISASPAANAALTFKPAAGFDAGTNPSSVARGDLDGDGAVDLVVANFGSDSVSVLAGRGDGSFRAPRNYPVGESPRDVEVADFDGDGSPDVVTANANSNDVSLLLNSGSGTLGQAIALQVGSAPFSIARGDLNGDGRPDLVTANFQDAEVSVLINNGNANFSPDEAFGTGSGPFSIRVADFNNDGRPDLATADSNADTVSVRLNSTVAGATPVTFGAPASFPVGDAPFAITGADFNSDGRPDLATANSEADSVSILLGLGAGAFSAPIPFSVGDSPYDLVAGDFDGDRNVDLASADFGSDRVTVLPGLGNGSFGPGLTSPTGNGPFGVLAADLNEDRVPDLATADLDAGKASVLINGPTAALSTDSLGFGAPVPVPKGTVSSPRTVTITNGGSAPLVISGFSLSGDAPGDFMIENDSCQVSVPTGETCRIRVRFAPGGTGIRSATLTAQTNAASNPSILLSGQAGPFPKPNVTCKSSGPIRRPKITCRVSYPSNTLSASTRWTLSRSGVTVRRGRATSSGPLGTLEIGNLEALPGGRYLLRVAGEPVASFRLPR
jgi:hypothetical protein